MRARHEASCLFPPAGNVPAASDFVCKVPCEWGPNAMASSVQGTRKQLPQGIYVPPFAINNANNQVRRLQCCVRTYLSRPLGAKGPMSISQDMHLTECCFLLLRKPNESTILGH